MNVCCCHVCNHVACRASSACMYILIHNRSFFISSRVALPANPLTKMPGWEYNSWHGPAPVRGWLYSVDSWNFHANLTWHVEKVLNFPVHTPTTDTEMEYGDDEQEPEYFWVAYVWFWQPQLKDWACRHVISQAAKDSDAMSWWMVHEF